MGAPNFQFQLTWEHVSHLEQYRNFEDKRCGSRHNELAMSRSSLSSSSSSSRAEKRNHRQEEEKHERDPSILSRAYLEGAGSNKNEAVRRLRQLTSLLIELDDAEGQPALASLAAALVEPTWLHSSDKRVRLHTVLACVELFYLYAPQPPWDKKETLDIFDQMIRQLGNLANSTESNCTEFESYFHILEQLSEVKIGAVLVDFIRVESSFKTRAEETLVEFIHTLLHGVSIDHPPEVANHAINSIASCIEEFEALVPSYVLEELLIAVGRGPVEYASNPAHAKAVAANVTAAKQKKELPFIVENMPPAHIQQSNCAYLVAAKVIRRVEDKVSTPMAALLNGLLGGDVNVVKQTSISCVDGDEGWESGIGGQKGRKGKKTTSGTPDNTSLVASMCEDLPLTTPNVYSITYELHRIAPNILTTVIGTVATNLVSADTNARGRATKLLGRIFGARSSDVARRFRPCFREWLRRSIDSEPKIRESMVKCLINFLTNKYVETDLCADVNESLASIITNDPNLDIRLTAIHLVCDLVHSTKDVTEGSNDSLSSAVSMELLQAVGNRVSSKNKTEHRDAITGLAQIYHKQYLMKKLSGINQEGDDVNIDFILSVLRDECGFGECFESGATGSQKRKMLSEDESKFGWIPQKVFECVSFSDATDPDMRNRVFQIVDDVLLGSVKKDAGSIMTPTSRAVGLAIILHSLKDKENAYKWMCSLFSQRANLQRALSAYLDTRMRAKALETGSAEAFTTDAEAMEKLEIVASLSAPFMSSNSSSSDLFTLLKKLHTAKDKHIFRILSTISTPLHSPVARARAFDELPKRTKSLGDVLSLWVKTLARRCAMGTFFNVETIEHCIILAQECFESEDCGLSSLFMECVKSATSVFPALGATEEGFKNLAEFFEVCRDSSVTQRLKKDIEKYDLVTDISDVLAKAASYRTASDKKNDNHEGSNSSATLRAELLRLCTRDGNPEQARNSVFAMSSLINPQTQSPVDFSSRIYKEKKEFEPLLKALINPSRLFIPDENTNPKQKDRIVSVLSALAAVAECAPYAFNAHGDGNNCLGCGGRALHFALNTVILGKSTCVSTSQEQCSDSESEHDGVIQTNRSRSSTTRLNKEFNKSSKEISVHCLMICGAIEVLVSHIKSTIMRVKTDGTRTKTVDLQSPTPDHLSEVFNTLIKIIEDDGMPPSSANGRYCKTNRDKAELRRCAAVNLLKLCDASLQLEQKYLTPRMWHIFSNVFLDKEVFVREAVMEELSLMFTNSRFMPNLRFVALITLCADGDHVHSVANASAANVGRRSNSLKAVASQCIKSIRNTFQSTQAQCRSLGREAEKNFESKLKMKIMPEYCVPYALHLLAFRHETMSAAGSLNADDSLLDDDVLAFAEASQKMLKKRLKWLFDPLIQSLGEGADNISFLLRMVELIGKHPPINVLQHSIFSSETDFDRSAVEKGTSVEKEAAARMQVICHFARENLLSYVKKDVNLTMYPGSIALPADLYAPRQRSPQSPVPKDTPNTSMSEGRRKLTVQADKSTPLHDSSSKQKIHSTDAAGKYSAATNKDHSDYCGSKRHTFSPFAYPLPSNGENFDAGLNLSPITKNDSPTNETLNPVKKVHSSESRSLKSNKRKSHKLESSNEFPSPLQDSIASPTFTSRTSSDVKHSFIKPKKLKSSSVSVVTTSNRKKPSSQQSKATPVSVTSKVMVNITNTTSCEKGSSSSSQRPSRRKKVSKNNVDEFDFSDSPGRIIISRSKGPSKVLSPKRSSPARKSQVIAKVNSTKRANKTDTSPSTTSPTEPSPPSCRKSARLRSTNRH